MVASIILSPILGITISNFAIFFVSNLISILSGKNIPFEFFAKVVKKEIK